MRRQRLGPALAALALVYAAMLLLGAGSADQAILGALYVGDRPALTAFARVVTRLGGFTELLPFILAAAIAGWALRRDWRAPACFVAMVLAGRLFVELQKGWVMRLRPDPLEQLAPIQSYAFPSGHSANAVMVWLGAALLVARGPARPWAIAAAALIAVLVGLSRPMLGVHWPSDVLGGWSFGLAWTLILVTLSARLGTSAPAVALSVRRRPEMDKVRPDDTALIDEMEDAPAQGGVSGGNLQREIAARAEEEHEIGSGGGEGDAVTRVHGGDKPRGGDRPNLPNRD